MNIGGLIKNSMIDYPGKLSCGIFLSGCNFDCPYCHNPELVGGCALRAGNFDPDSVYRFIETRKGFLDGIVISGGEPTLQTDLHKLCRDIKKMGYPVKLDTNGSRPLVIERLIAEGLVDYIAMDLKTDPNHYVTYIQSNCDIKAILTSIEMIMNSGVDYEFRTTCVKPIVTAQTIENISRLIKGADRYALQRFHKSEMLHPEFFSEINYEYSDAEMDQLRKIAEPYVKNCLVR
jgi:pyruvate formate lyase activating enzyme